MRTVFFRMPRRAALLACALLSVFYGRAFAEPEIWFAPEDSVRRSERGDPWKSDFMDLFAPDAPWKKAASRVQVFQIYPQFLDRASDLDLRAVIDGLKQRGIALALSYGMLHRPKGAAPREGYGAEIAERDIARLKRLGADVRYVIADEPLWFGHFYRGHGSEPWSVRAIAEDMASTAKLFRAAFPGVRIGMDDPIMLYKDREWAPAMRELLETFRAEFGEPMGCVRLENVGSQVREWLPRFSAAAELFHSVGVGFGMLVTGDASDTSDEQWFAKAEERYCVWESEGHAATAQMVFQSWMPRPMRILPESQPGTHSRFVNGYFRERTAIAASVGSGNLRARLTTESGLPISNAPVTLDILPGFGARSMIRRSIMGKVPAEAQMAQVGLRIGIEGSREGAAHLALGAAHYFEAGLDGQSAIFGFEHGLKGWGTSGDAHAEPKVVGDSAAASLEIDADAGQTLLANSKKIPVTPGRDFAVDFETRLRAGSETGFFAVFFFDASGKVILRLAEPFVPENPSSMGAQRTDGEGWIGIPTLSAKFQTAREIRLTYPGDDQRRPVFARIYR